MCVRVRVRVRARARVHLCPCLALSQLSTLHACPDIAWLMWTALGRRLELTRGFKALHTFRWRSAGKYITIWRSLTWKQFEQHCCENCEKHTVSTSTEPTLSSQLSAPFTSFSHTHLQIITNIYTFTSNSLAEHNDTCHYTDTSAHVTLVILLQSHYHYSLISQ